MKYERGWIMDNNINEILDKVIGILGYDAYDAFIKTYYDTKKKRIEYKTDNEIVIKKEIMDNNQLTLEQKIELNAVLGKNLKGFKRQIDILGIAVDNMDNDAKAENLNGDWLLDFFDKASLITEDDTKLIWGKLLSYASSDKHICSKTLLKIGRTCVIRTKTTRNIITIIIKGYVIALFKLSLFSYKR